MSQSKYNRFAKNRRQKSVLPLVIITIGGLLFLLAFAFNIGQTPRPARSVAKSNPVMKVDKERVDLGDVQLGKTVQVSFQISNVGVDTLQFSEDPYVEVKEGC